MAKYISGSAKKGTITYYFVKDAVTGKLDTDCTRYLKHKVRQNRANNTIKRIAYILPFYMNFLCDPYDPLQIPGISGTDVFNPVFHGA